MVLLLVSTCNKTRPKHLIDVQIGFELLNPQTRTTYENYYIQEFFKLSTSFWFDYLLCNKLIEKPGWLQVSQPGGIRTNV